MSYIHWNKRFGIKSVGVNIITKLISQQGYTSPAHLGRAYVDIGTAQMWLAERLCFTCQTMKSHFRHGNLYITDLRKHRHFHTEMLSKNTAKRHCHYRLGIRLVWNLLHHSLDSVTKSHSYVSRPAGPSICLNRTKKHWMGLEFCVILDYCFAN